MSIHPEAFVLVHIPEVTLATNDASESGTLALECVTLAPDDADKNAPLAASLSASDRSLILVLRLGSLELPLDPARSISLHIDQDGTRTYAFNSDTVEQPIDDEPLVIRLTVPIPSKPDPHRAETIEAFDHMLVQYADFDWHADSEGVPHDKPPQSQAETDAEEDLRGKLVLMDEQTGEVVGELPNRVNIEEDPALKEHNKGKDGEPSPVMVELPPDVYDAYTGAGTSVVPYAEETPELDEAREIFVRAIPPEDQDWMTKSATIISQAISSSTTMLLSGLTHASNYYINHSAPAHTPTSSKETGGQTSANSAQPPPSRTLLLLSHPRTHQTLSSAYAISGQAVKVSKHTVSVVEKMISRAVGATSTKGKDSPAPPPPIPASTTSAQSTPSVLSDAPPPPYLGTPPTPTPTQDAKPPLPSRRNGPAASVPPPGPAPPLPPRSKGPLPGTAAPPPTHIPLPPSQVPSASTTPVSTPKPICRREKMLLSANLLLATFDDSLNRAFDVGSERATAVVGHKYGPDAAKSTHLATHTARNVVLVYVDMQGFARKALIKKVGKRWLQARFAGGKEMSGLVVDKQEQTQK